MRGVPRLAGACLSMQGLGGAACLEHSGETVPMTVEIVSTGADHDCSAFACIDKVAPAMARLPVRCVSGDGFHARVDPMTVSCLVATIVCMRRHAHHGCCDAQHHGNIAWLHDSSFRSSPVDADCPCTLNFKT